MITGGEEGGVQTAPTTGNEWEGRRAEGGLAMGRFCLMEGN